MVSPFPFLPVFFVETFSFYHTKFTHSVIQEDMEWKGTEEKNNPSRHALVIEGTELLRVLSKEDAREWRRDGKVLTCSSGKRGKGAKEKLKPSSFPHKLSSPSSFGSIFNDYPSSGVRTSMHASSHHKLTIRQALTKDYIVPQRC